MENKTKFDLRKLVVAPQTAADVVAWGATQGRIFWKIDQLPEGFNCIPLKEDTSIIPTQILKLVAEIGLEFPTAEFYICHKNKPVKPPVKIPWKEIGGVVTAVFTVIAAIALTIAAAAMIASIGTFLLLGLAMAAYDPWILVKINGEVLCVALYYD